MRTLTLALTLGLALAARPCIGAEEVEAPADEREVVRVKTADELLRAIQPGRIIELEPGEYVVSEVPVFESRWVKFVNAAIGADAGRQDLGHEITLTDVHHLTLRPADPKRPPTLLAEPRFALVLHLQSCHTIELRGLIMGHTHKGICSAGVLGVTDSDRVTVDGCELFGCGYEGFTLRESNDLLIRGCRVHDCKGALMEIASCRRVRFERTTFEDNREIYDGIRMRKAHDIDFHRCVIRRNATRDGGRATLFDLDEHSRGVRFLDGALHDNKFDQLTNQPDHVLIELSV